MDALVAAAKMDPSTWVALVIGAVAVCYVMLRPKRRKDPLNKPLSSISLAQQRSVERQMSELVVQFSEMARQMSATLDTRVAKLQALLDDADDRIARLEQLARSADGGTPPLLSNHAEPGPSPVADITPHLEQVDPRHAEIYALADDGRTTSEIAAKTHRQLGEIELILALRPRESTPG